MSTSPTLAKPLQNGAGIDSLQIRQLLDQGEFNTTYLATDSLVGRQFVLREYCPQPCAERLADDSLYAPQTSKAEFDAGLQEFLTGGRILAGLQHRNLISVLRCFEAKGTAFMLMPFHAGQSLNQHLEQRGPLVAAELGTLLTPMLEVLQYLHQNSVFHQAIEPSNIIITTEGDALLQVSSGILASGHPQDVSANSLTYSAPEQQLGSAGPIGPWTDIYGLAATFYHAATGEMPVSAAKRQQAIIQGLADPLSMLDAEVFPDEWQKGIAAGLKLQADQRPADVAQWSGMFNIELNSAGNHPRLLTAGTGQNPSEEHIDSSNGERTWFTTMLVGLLVILLGLMGFYLIRVESFGPAGGSPNPGSRMTGDIEQAPEDRNSELSRRWQGALEADTLFAYQQFLQDFPNSLHQTAVRNHLARLDDALWQSVHSEGSRSAYESYLKQLPQGRHEADARIRLNELDLADAESERQRAMRENQDDVAWKDALRQHSIPAMDHYISEFPDGKYLPEAQSIRRKLSETANDGSAFVAAQKLNTKKAYQAYVDAFPRGQHIVEALKAIENLTLRPGKRFRDCDQCPELVVLPAGTFLQGADASSPRALENEKPQHKVILNQAFAIGIHEVTLAQWDACVEAGACETTVDNGWGRDLRPVIMVSWNDAQTYLKWLSAKTGETYRLPSESEWEYAARAGETDEWPEADPAYVCSLGNIAGSETGLRWAHQDCSDPFVLETAPAGSFPANALGIQDSLGNVAEWTLDCMSLSYHDAPTDGSANERGLCHSRVTRGGSWFSGARESRLSARFNLKSGDKNDFTGFRVVREVAPGS